MNTKKHSNMLANLANSVTILIGMKELGFTLSGISGLLVLIQASFSDFWVKTIIAFVQILFIVILYFCYRVKESICTQREQYICDLEGRFAAEKSNYERQIKELQTKLSVGGCEFNPSELETYSKCIKNAKKGGKVPFTHLVLLKNGFLKCSRNFKEKANKVVECLKNLLPLERELLVHVDFSMEDKELANEIHELLNKHSIHSTFSILDGIDEVSYKPVAIESCSWIIVLYERSNCFETLESRLNTYKNYRSRFKTRILMCSSKMQYDEINTWVDREEDLIHPSNYSTAIINRLKGANTR